MLTQRIWVQHKLTVVVWVRIPQNLVNSRNTAKGTSATQRRQRHKSTPTNILYFQPSLWLFPEIDQQYTAPVIEQTKKIMEAKKPLPAIFHYYPGMLLCSLPINTAAALSLAPLYNPRSTNPTTLHARACIRSNYTSSHTTNRSGARVRSTWENIN